MPTSIPPPAGNEPVQSYAPQTAARKNLQAALAQLEAQAPLDLPMHIGGRAVRGSGKELEIRAPHRHSQLLARAAAPGEAQVQEAIESALAAGREWSHWSWESRAAIFLRAAELLSGPWRDRLNAATMLGQSKTAYQAEIDSACELIDFWRWNVHFGARLMEEQPVSAPGVWNRMELRPLEGFVLAITPFNFTSIAGNLPTAPALMGNTVIWKPATTQLLAASVIMELLEAAGLPPGVINLITGGAAAVSGTALSHPALAGIHFTGSTAVFHQLWQGVAGNLERYQNYPRIVGETGGKDFIVAHESASQPELLVGLLRGAFEYQGQKCSAASRAYIPKDIWQQLRDSLAGATDSLSMGSPTDFRNFMCAVIDESSYRTQEAALNSARKDSALKIVAGGECDASEGWFVRPSIVETSDPKHDLMQRELFGPVLTVYPYDLPWSEVLQLVDQTSPYGLTGAIFADDRGAVDEGLSALRQAAGNIYINDKPTGAVVGQQPFGGARQSGTNDKAGSAYNLLRWVSPRVIKENFVPPREWLYPHQLPD